MRCCYGSQGGTPAEKREVQRTAHPVCAAELRFGESLLLPQQDQEGAPALIHAIRPHLRC